MIKSVESLLESFECVQAKFEKNSMWAKRLK